MSILKQLHAMRLEFKDGLNEELEVYRQAVDALCQAIVQELRLEELAVALSNALLGLQFLFIRIVVGQRPIVMNVHFTGPLSLAKDQVVMFRNCTFEGPLVDGSVGFIEIIVDDDT